MILEGGGTSRGGAYWAVMRSLCACPWSWQGDPALPVPYLLPSCCSGHDVSSCITTHSLLWCDPLPQTEKPLGHPAWIRTSKTVSQNKTFLFISWLSDICYLNRELSNKSSKTHTPKKWNSKKLTNTPPSPNLIPPSFGSYRFLWSPWEHKENREKDSKMAVRGRKQKVCLPKWNLGETLDTHLTGKAEKRQNFDPSTPPDCKENLHFTLNREIRRAPRLPVTRTQTAWEDADHKVS
jgi:hypothetical protein